jgi:small subunit ribosomal protein S20
VANIKGQIKRNRQNERRRVRNKATRSELKSRVKVAERAVFEGTDDAPEALRQAQKRLGKASAKGRIHKNQAARRTSRLMKRAARGAGGGTKAPGSAKRSSGSARKAAASAKRSG